MNMMMALMTLMSDWSDMSVTLSDSLTHLDTLNILNFSWAENDNYSCHIRIAVFSRPQLGNLGSVFELEIQVYLEWYILHPPQYTAKTWISQINILASPKTDSWCKAALYSVAAPITVDEVLYSPKLEPDPEYPISSSVPASGFTLTRAKQNRYIWYSKYQIEA